MSEQTPFFSVIVPIYNVEQYLNECVDSVLRQSFSDIEVILVDDGSPDNCGAICDAYQARDSRIRVIHKPNGGLSDARNAGIRLARGTYLLFLDSDDYWDDPEALRQLRDDLTGTCPQADIGIFQAKLLYPDGSMQPDQGVFSEHFRDMEPEESLRYLSQNGLLVGSACSKAIRRSFVLEHDLFFKVGIKSEDIDWILRVANCLPKYTYSDQFFYIYRKGRDTSITSNVDLKYLQTFADMLEGFCAYPWSSTAVQECLMGYVAYEYTILMAKAVNLPRSSEKAAFLKRVRAMSHLLRCDIHPKVRKVNLVRRILGLRATMELLGLYLKHRNR